MRQRILSSIFVLWVAALGCEAKAPEPREPALDAYGVKYDSHRAVWVGKENVISIIERPGTNGRTEVVA